MVSKRRSVMTHQFSEIPRAEIPRSSFDRSHGLKTTFDGGYLVPVFLDEVVPGDTFNLRMSAFARLATPIKPVMDNMTLSSFFFFCPTRLVWDNFPKFMGAQDNPGDSTDFTVPLLSGPNAIGENTIGDYMGLPINLIPNDTEVNALPFRCYNLIFNEWFRDQNLQNSVTVKTDDTSDGYATTYQLLRRGKRHDYFTSCLPWPQKPGIDTDIPVLGNAPIFSFAQTNSVLIGDRPDITDPAYDLINLNASTATLEFGSSSTSGNALYADLSSATGVSVNALRLSFQLQRMGERDARGGTRLTEVIHAHFGVTNPDFRLQRPEFLGGGSSPVNFHAVAQTQRTDTGEDPQGNLAAYSTTSVRGHGFTRSFTEPGYIIGLVSVQADLTYQQGLNRLWSRSTRYDFYWPALSHIGEQAVLNKEIFVSNSVADELVFGYQERYGEYRYKPSMITGLFRSDAASSLDFWHLSQDFSSTPVLDDTFIQDTPPIDRVIAVTGEPHFLFDAYFQLRCARPMPLYGVPGYIDRF